MNQSSRDIVIDSVVYWAVLLDAKSKENLLIAFPAKHFRVFAEHLTLVFRPTTKQNEDLLRSLGDIVDISVLGEVSDLCGQAVLTSGVRRCDSGTAHITISCADGVSPSYSNKILDTPYIYARALNLRGTIAAFTRNKGWVTKHSEK